MKVKGYYFCSVRHCVNSNFVNGGYHFCEALPAIIDSEKYDEKEDLNVNAPVGRTLFTL